MDEDIKIRKMVDDYYDKPIRDAGRALLKILIGLFAVAALLSLASWLGPVLWMDPDSAPGIVAWIELLWCRCD